MSSATPSAVAAAFERSGSVPPRYWRHVLRYFEQTSVDVVTVGELRGHLVESPRTDVDADADTVAAYLHHSTLPKLAESNVLEYDPRSNTARYRGL